MQQTEVRHLTQTATTSNKQVVEEFDRVLNTRDLSRLDQLCTRDMVNHALAPSRPAGLAGGHWPGGPFLGFPTQPGDYRREVVFMYRLRNGRICERWAVRDDLTMLRQLQAL